MNPTDVTEFRFNTRPTTIVAAVTGSILAVVIVVGLAIPVSAVASPPRPASESMRLSDVFVAAATMALAWFGAVQLQREERRRREAQQASAARVSALAYLLRLRVRSWTADASLRPDDLAQWVRGSVALRTLESEIDLARSQALAMMELAGAAGGETVDAVRRCFVIVWAATRRIHAMSRRDGVLSNRTMEGVLEGYDLQNHAHADLLLLLSIVEKELIDPALLASEQELEIVHTADNSLDRLIEQVEHTKEVLPETEAMAVDPDGAQNTPSSPGPGSPPS